MDHEQDKLFLALDGAGISLKDEGATWIASALDPAEVPTCPGLHDAMADLLAKCGISKSDARVSRWGVYYHLHSHYLPQPPSTSLDLPRIPTTTDSYRST